MSGNEYGLELLEGSNSICKSDRNRPILVQDSRHVCPNCYWRLLLRYIHKRFLVCIELYVFFMFNYIIYYSAITVNNNK